MTYRLTGVAALVAASTLAGCAMTPHKNTMIFATSTRTAIDVSQDATGLLGVTVGYKRLEAVWMPLLPDQGQVDKDGKVVLTPAPCHATAVPKEPCPMYQGSSAEGDRDTYSVLGTFSGQASGVAGGAGAGVEGKGQIAQFFATGLAARKLAEPGGNAALFNTSAGSAPDAKALKDMVDQQRTSTQGVQQLLARVRASDGKAIDDTKFTAWTDALAKQPGINEDFVAIVQRRKAMGEPELVNFLENRWPRQGAAFVTAADAAKL